MNGSNELTFLSVAWPTLVVGYLLLNFMWKYRQSKLASLQRALADLEREG
jgi:hypothetical protein